MLKNREDKVRGELSPYRTVSEREIAAISKYYKKIVSPDTPVYKIEGVLDKISLTVNHSTSSEYWIGGIQVFSKIGAAEGCFLDDDLNQCEVVYLHEHKKQAYPLIINGCSIHQSFSGTPVGETVDPGATGKTDPYTNCTYRDATVLEQCFISRKLPWLAYLFLLPLLALAAPPLFIDMDMTEGDIRVLFPYLFAGGFFLLLSLFFLVKKRAYREGRKEIHCLRGILQESSDRKRFKKVYDLKGTKYKFVLPLKYAKSYTPQNFVAYPIDVYVKQANANNIMGTIIRTDSYSVEDFFENKLIKFYRPFVVEALLFLLLGLFHLNLAGSGTPFFDDSSFSKILEYYQSGPKIVSTSDDLDSLEAGDVVIFKDMLSMNTDYWWNIVPVEDNFFETIDFQPDAEGYALSVSLFLNHLDDVFKMYLRYEDSKPVSIFDDLFFTDPLRPVYCIDNTKLNDILYDQWSFDKFNDTGNSLRAAFRRNDSAENIHPVLIALVEETKGFMRRASRETVDHFSRDIAYSLGRDPGFPKVLDFSLYNDDVVLDEYIDPRWSSNDMDVLKPLVYESVKGLSLCGFLNGTYYTGDIKVAGETDYYSYDYDTFSFGNFNIFNRILFSYLISLGFFFLGIVTVLFLVLLKSVEFIRSRFISSREGSCY
jgi:hypothetical protein